MGEKGAWVFQRWLRDQIARDVPLDELVRRIVAGLGSTWQNPAVELLPDQPRPDDGRGERRAGLPGHPHPVRPMPQPPVRRLDPGRLLRPGGVLLQHRAQGARQRPQGQPRQARDQRRRDHLPGRCRRRIVQPRTGAVLEPTVLHGPRPIGPAASATTPSIGWPTG